MISQRYHRHTLIDWFDQECISRTRIIVIGAGAIGNEIIKNLTLLGVGEILIFDCDIIEEHNLSRSVLYREEHIGRSKAEVAAEQAALLDSNVSISGVRGDFWDTLTFAELRSSDMVFCCVDNYEARIRCNMLCYLGRVDFVNVAIDSRFALVEHFAFSRESFKGCLECNLPDSVYSRIRERYSCGYLRKRAFIEKKIPTTIITATSASSFAVSVGLRLGLQGGNSAGVRIYIDTIGGTLTRVELGRRDDCPCCGRYADVSVIVTCRRAIEKLPDEWLSDTMIFTSEPLLVSYRVAGRESIVFDLASKFDSAFPGSLTFNADDVELKIEDQFSLAVLAGDFAGYSMPCKFAVLQLPGRTVVCEFKEEGDEGG